MLKKNFTTRPNHPPPPPAPPQKSNGRPLMIIIISKGILDLMIIVILVSRSIFLGPLFKKLGNHSSFYEWNVGSNQAQKWRKINPLTPEDFHVFEWFSAFTRPIGPRDSIFKVTIESAAVLKHWRFEFTGNVIVTLSFCFVELQKRLKYGISAIFGKFTAIFHL